MSDHDYKILKRIEESPTISQRELADELGVSVGKINYCVKALMARGWVKAQNFKNSNNKIAYMYLLTPKGIASKSRLARAFLDRKLDEYERLQREIAILKEELRKESRTNG